MREQPRDRGRLEHIMASISKVEEFTKGFTFEQFENDVLHLHATTYNVQIIGEAVYKLTEDFKRNHSDTQWDLIEKMRHILVHDYYKINTRVLWEIIQTDIPELKEQVERYLEEE